MQYSRYCIVMVHYVMMHCIKLVSVNSHNNNLRCAAHHTPKVAPPHASKEKASRRTSLASTAPSTRSKVRTRVARRDW